MALKNTEVDTKEIELETWPAFVDILSSTVVVLAFAFFILVVVQSVSRITSSSQKEQQNSGGGGAAKLQQSKVISEKDSKFQKLSIISPATLANNKTPLIKSVTESDKRIQFVPKKATPSKENVKVNEIGESREQVLGTIPKFTKSRVMEVLKQLVIVQQDVIEQQRKVIEQQETKVESATREYQSLLSLITKNPEIEQLRQKIIPRDQQAKFIKIDNDGNLISGTSKSPKGKGNYVLSPPNSANKNINITTSGKDDLVMAFEDNAQYLNAENLKKVKQRLKENLVKYKAQGATIAVTPSSYALSVTEGRRIAISRMLIIRSLLIDMGVDANNIKFAKIPEQADSSNEQSYGIVKVIVRN